MYGGKETSTLLMESSFIDIILYVLCNLLSHSDYAEFIVIGLYVFVCFNDNYPQLHCFLKKNSN